MLVGEQDTQEEGRRAGMVVGSGQAGGSGRTVVTVGDVESIDAGEVVADCLDSVRLLDDPRDVADAVPGLEIDIRCFGGQLGAKTIELRHRAVGKKGRTGLRIKRLDVSGPVVFLVRPGQLVFLDEALVVFSAAGQSD